MSLDDVKFSGDAQLWEGQVQICLERWPGLPRLADVRSDPLSHHHGLPHRKLTAGTPNHVLGGTGFHELEPVAERIFVADQREKLHVAKGQSELQANHFTHRNFLPQHGRDSRLADVHGVASNHRTVARVHPDAYFQLEPLMAAGFRGLRSLVGTELIARFQSNRLPTRTDAAIFPAQSPSRVRPTQPQSKPKGSYLGIGTVRREL